MAAMRDVKLSSDTLLFLQKAVAACPTQFAKVLSREFADLWLHSQSRGKLH
eukprot:TRINITY_DN1002_c0_g1_i2.p3 TRINITY_DN1002_c0_g1~~TRINITY_DN1002_c0_g1_i2.p3  ORF type:complete len:51 (+),score=11.79 TRINITY_DN1002_c0_g1_i2:409-561(+)